MKEKYATSESADPPIESLVIDDSQRASEWNIHTGEDREMRIVPYCEPDGSLWFMVEKDHVVYKRINARFVVEVNYVR